MKIIQSCYNFSKKNSLHDFFYILLYLSFFSSFLYSEQNPQIKNQNFWQWDLPSGSYPIHYIEKGNGSHHVVLLHGFAANSFTWRLVINDLANAGYHVWAIDLIGSGLSEKPIDLPFGIRLFTDQIEAFMKAKEIKQAVLVGNSMGGGLALSTAIAYPHRIQALVLIDALAFPLKLPFYFSATRTMGSLSKPFIGKWAVTQILKQVMNDPNKVSEEQIQAYDFPFHTPGGKEAFIKTLQNFNQQELQNLTLHYKEIQAPILIIWGEKDRWMSLDYFQKLAKTFPKAKTVVIPNCGHIPQEECPLEVKRALLEFLNKVF